MTHWSLVWLLNWRHVAGLSIFGALVWSSIFAFQLADGAPGWEAAAVAVPITLALALAVSIVLLAIYLVTT